MRTTIDIADELMRTAKKRAADEDTTFRELVDRALRQYFSGPPSRRTFKLRWRPHAGGRLQPGVVLEDRDNLFDAMEGRR
jgi:Arc/MetJ family transcription regulator